MWLLLLTVACQDSDPAPAPPPPPAPRAANDGAPRVRSPSDGSRVVTPMIPLIVDLSPSDAGREVTVTVDGAPYVDTLARVRSAKGRPQLLAMLDLTVVEPGSHVIEVSAGGARSATSTFEWARPPRRVVVRLTDAGGAPVPGRVVVYGPNGPVLHGGPDAGRFDPTGRDAAIDAALAPDGEVTLWLGDGPHTLYGARGVRDGVAVHEVPPSGDHVVTLVVDRVVPTTSAFLADVHVHGLDSRDSHTPDRARWASLMASGLDLVVMSDHNLVSDPAEAHAALDPTGRLVVVTGTEARMGASGDPIAHYNVFPLAPGTELPDMAPHDPAKHWSAWRALPGDRILQLNHPRGMDIGAAGHEAEGQAGLFEQLGLDLAAPDGWARRPGGLDFDALEVVNRSSWPLYRATRDDWFVLLRHGVVVTGTGNSDSHSVAVELAGFPSNVVYGPPTAAGLRDALVEGRVTVTTGPMVEAVLRMDAAEIGPGGLIQGHEGAVEAVVRAAPWVPVHEVRLVVDGVVVAREPLADPLPGVVDRGRFVWPVDLAADGFVIVEAGWPIDDPAPAVGGVYAKVAPGYVPLGFTNPMRVDVDRDGQWKQPPAP
jgi:hypothetical protein